jgi:hypothetical protein
MKRCESVGKGARPPARNIFFFPHLSFHYLSPQANAFCAVIRFLCQHLNRRCTAVRKSTETFLWARSRHSSPISAPRAADSCRRAQTRTMANPLNPLAGLDPKPHPNPDPLWLSRIKCVRRAADPGSAAVVTASRADAVTEIYLQNEWLHRYARLLLRVGMEFYVDSGRYFESLRRASIRSSARF